MARYKYRTQEECDAMIDIGGKLVNPAHIASAEVETRHYMNGSTSKLVVVLVSGQRIECDHGWGFDAFAALAKLKSAANG